MSTDPVGHESCLGRAPTEDADRAQEPSPFAHAMTLSRPDTPVIAKTARLAVTMIPGGVSARDSPNVPSADGRQQPKSSKILLYT